MNAHKTCPQCATPVDASLRFCTNCGTPLAAAAPTPAAERPTDTTPATTAPGGPVAATVATTGEYPVSTHTPGSKGAPAPTPPTGVPGTPGAAATTDPGARPVEFAIGRNIGANLRRTWPLRAVLGALGGTLAGLVVVFALGTWEGTGLSEDGAVNPWWGWLQIHETFAITSHTTNAAGYFHTPVVHAFAFVAVTALVLRLVAGRRALSSAAPLLGAWVLALVTVTIVLLVLGIVFDTANLDHRYLRVDSELMGRYYANPAWAVLFVPVLTALAVLGAYRRRNPLTLARNAAVSAAATGARGGVRLFGAVSVALGAALVAVSASGREQAPYAGARTGESSEIPGALFSSWAELVALAHGAGGFFGLDARGYSTGLFSSEDSRWVPVTALLVVLAVSVAAGLKLATQLPTAAGPRAAVLTLPLTYAILAGLLFIYSEVTAVTFYTWGTAVAIVLGVGLLTGVVALAAQPLLLKVTPLGRFLAGKHAHPQVAAALTRRNAPAPAATRMPATTGTVRPLVRGAALAALVGLLAGTALLVTAAHPASEAGDMFDDCASVFSARSVAPVPKIANNPDGDFKAAIDTAAADAALAEKRRKKIVKSLPRSVFDLPEQLEDARKAVTVAENDLKGARARLRTAERELDYVDETGFYEEQVDDAREYYDEYGEFDDDGYWLEMLEDAQESLAEAEADIAGERADVAAATNVRDEAQAALNAANGEVARLEALLEPHTDTLAELDQLEYDVSAAATDGTRAAARWDTEYARRTEDRDALAALADDCRSWGQTGTRVAYGSGAGIVIAALAAAAAGLRRPGRTPTTP